MSEVVVGRQLSAGGVVAETSRDRWGDECFPRRICRDNALSPDSGRIEFGGRTDVERHVLKYFITNRESDVISTEYSVITNMSAPMSALEVVQRTAKAGAWLVWQRRGEITIDRSNVFSTFGPGTAGLQETVSRGDAENAETAID